MSAADEVLGMLLRPWMFRRNMVRHEIEKQAQSVLGELTSGRRKPTGTAQMLVDQIAPDAIGGTDVVG